MFSTASFAYFYHRKNNINAHGTQTLYPDIAGQPFEHPNCRLAAPTSPCSEILTASIRGDNKHHRNEAGDSMQRFTLPPNQHSCPW